MAERDPFGRLPDENPLAGLGWLSNGSDGQGAAEPAAANWGATEEAASEPVEQQERARARERAPMAAGDEPAAAAVPGLQPAQVLAFVRRVIRIARTVVAIVVALIVVMIALGIAFGDDDPSTTPGSEPSGAVPALPAPPPPASEEDSSTQTAGLQPRSLMTPDNVSRAMSQLARSGLGRLRALRIAPARIDVQLVTREGKLRSAQITTGGRQRTLSLSPPGFGGLPTIKFGDVNPAAPARMARGAAQRLKRPVSRVDYVALVGTGSQAAWTVVMRGGGQFLGDARGRITRRVG